MIHIRLIGESIFSSYSTCFFENLYYSKEINSQFYPSLWIHSVYNPNNESELDYTNSSSKTNDEFLLKRKYFNQNRK